MVSGVNQSSPSEMNIQQQYHYRPKWNTIVVCMGFFGACAVVLSLKAYHNDEELILRKLIHFSVNATTTFYWILAAAACAFVIASLGMTYLRFFHPKRITLTDDSIRLPAGVLNQREHHIPYTAITEIKEVEVINERFLYIHADGNRYIISQSMLSKRIAFDSIKAALNERLSENTKTVEGSLAE